MKPKNTQKNVIIVFDASIDLMLTVSRCCGDDFLIYHAHNPEEFASAVKRLNDNISIIVADDDNENHDTLEILEQYKNEPWFESASSLVIFLARNGPSGARTQDRPLMRRLL